MTRWRRGLGFDRPMRMAVALAAFGVLASGCSQCGAPPQPVDEGSGGSGDEAGSGSEGAAEGSADVPIDDSAMEGALPPDPYAAENTACSADTDCRVFQPSDWSPRVECCYDYPCRQDYKSVNLSGWAAIQSWRRANNFDCTIHLQEAGPCAQRPRRCGLDQEPPAARCVENECQVAWPSGGPRAVANAQRCVATSECMAYLPSSDGWSSRCCGNACGEDWTAINLQTAAEVQLWQQRDAPSCEEWAPDRACPEVEACSGTPPRVACVSGLCQLSDAR
ncbi:MAG: hypothetical protein ACJA1R_000584 [Flavobacteriales bacterium]|jgi:hypothetical protein